MYFRDAKSKSNTGSSLTTLEVVTLGPVYYYTSGIIEGGGGGD